MCGVYGGLGAGPGAEPLVSQGVWGHSPPEVEAFLNSLRQFVVFLNIFIAIFDSKPYFQ